MCLSNQLAGSYGPNPNANQQWSLNALKSVDGTATPGIAKVMIAQVGNLPESASSQDVAAAKDRARTLTYQMTGGATTLNTGSINKSVVAAPRAPVARSPISIDPAAGSNVSRGGNGGRSMGGFSVPSQLPMGGVPSSAGLAIPV